MARAAWGRDFFLGWAPELPGWRAYHYLGSVGPGDHRYQELGATATIAPGGELMALQLDDGLEFIALDDVSEPALRRGLEHFVGRGLPPVSRAEPAYEHRVRRYGTAPPGGVGGWLRRVVGR